MDTKDKIEQILQKNLQIKSLEIIDDSHLHVGHGASGAHFTVNVTAEEFKTKTPIQRHRLIYQLLQELLKQEVHALAINAKSP